MDFFEVIEKRYSHKEGFLPDAVPQEDLVRIAHAGLAAPSGANSQTVRLVLLPNRAAVQPLCDLGPTQGLETAPAAIALFTDSAAQQSKTNFEVEDYAAACENILLAAVALGYAALWLDFLYFDAERQKAACALLNAPETCRLRVVIPIGKPDGPGSRREKLPFEKRMFFGRFE